MKVRHTSDFLRSTVSDLWIGEPADCAKEFADTCEEQRERQNRIAELDALGADLIVDQITLDLLAAHGLDAEELLSQVWKEEYVNLTVQHGGQDASLSLHSWEGQVKAFIILEDAAWNGELLWIFGDKIPKSHRHLIGTSVGDVVRHPVFASRLIIDVVHPDADHIVFDLSEKLLFDADNRSIRSDERRAA